MSSLLPGLREAARVADAESARVLARGMSSFHFFFGLMTCLATAYMFGAMPESVWLVYACEALLILGYRLWIDWTTHTRPRTMFYFLDFCWIANFATSAIAFTILFQVVDDAFLGDRFPTLDIASAYPDLGRIVCLVATGPLGWSVVVLSNALVLHDIQLFSGCFIHLWPSITTLAVRWHPEQVMAAYPGHFDSLTGFHDPPSGASLFNLWKLGLLAYAVWWGPFTLWMLVHGRFQSPGRTNADTVYFNLVATNGVVRKLLGVPNKSNGEDAFYNKAASLGAVCKYMALHATLVQGSFFFSALCYKYMELHAAWAFMLVCVALYNASSRYHWNMTQRYSRAMAKAVAKAEAEANAAAKAQ
jgi:hypothetical protein